MAKKKAQKAQKEGEIAIKIINPVACTYGISAIVGDVIKRNEKQATEMVENGFAEYVK